MISSPSLRRCSVQASGVPVRTVPTKMMSLKKQFTLLSFLYSTLIEGVIALLWLLLIPGDPESAWIFSFSKFRLILLLAILLPLGLTSILTYKAKKAALWYQKASDRINALFQWDGHLTTGFVLSLSGLMYGSYFLYTALATTDLFLQGYFTRLAPLMFWFTALCGQTLYFIFHTGDTFKKYLRTHGFAVLTTFVILISGLLMHSHLWGLEPEDWDTHAMFNRDNKFDLEEQDIFAIFNEGDHLQHGQNPYARALEIDTNIDWNRIYATYLPISYTMAWLTQEVGLEDFLQWLSFWRVIFLVANLGITYLLIYIPYHRYNNLIFGAIAALFWLFNRWTLHMTMIYHIDFVAIFFLLFSLVSWPRHKVISLLSFGLSLGVKHIAMFVIPLYIIWIWQSVENRSIKQFVQHTLVMAGIPFLVSAPFLAWNAKGFFKSIFVSATRISESHFGAPALDTLLELSGISAKLPLLGLMAIVYLAAWTKKIKPFSAAFLILLIFVDFNSILFRQYMTWAFPVIPLVICETMLGSTEKRTISPQGR